MRLQNALLIMSILTGLSARTVATEKAGTIPPWPEAGENQVRYTIILPVRDNEHDHQVELIVGKTIEVDCNIHFFAGSLAEKELRGWGYSYYVLSLLSEPAITRMVCPDEKKHFAFVRVNLERAAFVPYNSRLPLVIYVPADMQVKYRVWSAETYVHDATMK